jgi:hypothetical protein
METSRYAVLFRGTHAFPQVLRGPLVTEPAQLPPRSLILQKILRPIKRLLLGVLH